MDMFEMMEFRVRWAWAKWTKVARRIDADPYLLAFASACTVLAALYILCWG